MIPHREGQEPVAVPCPVCGGTGSLFLLGQRHDPLSRGRWLRALFRRSAVTRVYHCAICDEVVLRRTRDEGAWRRGTA